jgi:hypothetical protein
MKDLHKMAMDFIRCPSTWPNGLVNYTSVQRYDKKRGLCFRLQDGSFIVSSHPGEPKYVEQFSTFKDVTKAGWRMI